MTTTSQPSPVELLILGAGWTSTFLIPLLGEKRISYGATTTTGRDGTYKFKFSFSSTSSDTHKENLEQYLALPAAKTVLITFPLTGPGASQFLHKCYLATHPSAEKSPPLFIQLGSSGIFQIPDQETWVTRKSKYDTSNARAIAEDELLGLGGCVLNLSGLYGGERDPRNWVGRVAKDKEQLCGKKSLHLIHGSDVARGILGVHQIQGKEKVEGERFILTDMMVYDWWALILSFQGRANRGEKDSKSFDEGVKWVGELLVQENVRALPRSMETLGRCYDTREFWKMIGGEMPSMFLY